MAKYTSKNTQFQITITNSLTTVAQVESLDAPDAEVEQLDVTALDSAVGREHQVTGYTEPGQGGGTVFYDPAGSTHTALTSYLATPTNNPVASKIKWSDGATNWTFSALIIKFSPKAAMGSFLKADFKFQVTGVVTGW